ncbi:hypothetical protein MPTK1_7g02760 [Marchantia polymorpha subsp. ruderalis]|uniref:F-box domain-containing protein n=2 Tax=Marchantia polymorpha TaxID=3197 RepID=A0AAF6BVH4_MARPO|nr:hypothetical protein MARPO_0088s0011 [Marchantia polymorpha]BBN16008.1 hypothetical protein Mp_7g02760 [Marchantia polymorpha subsp. ruderalis]|eukprot:PTQ33462.1 hypothetical protein MARPO_0088s0011 [Marchantia polymorpha]
MAEGERNDGRALQASAGATTNGSTEQQQQRKCGGEKNAQALVVSEAGSDWTKRDHVGSLFPGIPDDIAIEHILTKVTWKSLCMLSTVSRGWRLAIQSRQVHRARMRNNSTRTLVSTAHLRKDNTGFAISLYDPAEFRWLLLPPIPDIRGGIPYGCGCVVLDGNLYVVGGLDDEKPRIDVYKLDLAACKRVWEKCATMRQGRRHFPCVVKDDKIYVFEPRVTFSGEVFDPQRNEWTDFGDISALASPPGPWRMTSIAATVDEEIFVHAEELYQVYNTYTGAWRQVPYPDYADEPWRHTLVVVDGQLYDLLPDSVQVYSVSTDSWTCVQRISYHFVDNISISAAVPLDGELLTLFTCFADDGVSGERLVSAAYISSGFGRPDCNLVWSRICSPFQYIMGGDFSRLCTIQL